MVSKADVRSRRIRMDNKPVRCTEEVIGDLNQGWFCTVFGVEARLELFKKIVVVKISLELRCNYPLKDFGEEW